MSSAAGVPVVDVAVFGLSARAVPSAFWHLAVDRRRVWASPGLRFAKLLGTGDGRTFDVRDADVRRWAILTVWDDDAALRRWRASAPVLAGWRERAESAWQLTLRPLVSRGRWSGRQPFTPTAGGRHDGEVAAITRARLSLRHAATFWRAVPPVSAALRSAPGLRAAMGIGEAPIGLQGTLSVWRSAEDLRAFAYRGADHRHVVAETTRLGWYAEDLFARFAVIEQIGQPPPRRTATAD